MRMHDAGLTWRRKWLSIVSRVEREGPLNVQAGRVKDEKR